MIKYPMCDKMVGITIEDGAIIGAGAVIKASEFKVGKIVLLQWEQL